MAAKKLDIWTPRQVEICAKYAIGDDISVAQMLSGNIDAMGFLETVMKDKLLNDLLRERIISHNEGLIHSCKMHDYDAHDISTNRPVEIKSEQHSTLDDRPYQVTGGGAFGSIEDFENIRRLIEDNPIMHVNSFIDGRLVYNVAFDFNDSGIAERLIDTVDRRLKGAKTAPKFMWSDWIDARSLKIMYLNEDHYSMLFPYASKDLLFAVKRKWKIQQAELTSNLITELHAQTVMNIVSPDLDSADLTKTDPSVQISTPCTEDDDQSEIQVQQGTQPTSLCD